MKLAVLGNSHIGSIKKGWGSIAETYSDTELTFFGHRGRRIEGMQAKGGLLAPVNKDVEDAIKFTSGGPAALDPGAYDAILLYGTEAWPFFLEPARFYSQKALVQAVKDLFDNSLSVLLLDRLRTITSMPIYVGLEPCLAAAPEDHAADKECTGDTSDYEAGFAYLKATIFEPRDAILVGQPLDTIVNRRKTSAQFSKGTQRLSVGDKYDGVLHPKTDDIHMNGAFGALWLDKFFAMLGVQRNQ